MRRPPFISGSLAMLSLLGCAQTTLPPQQSALFDSTRSEVSMLSMAPLASQEKALEEQAIAIEAAAQTLVRSSTAKGAALGAVIGCGAGLAATGNAQSCATNAARAGLVGALAGNAAGRTKVERQAARLSPSTVVRNLRRTNDRLTPLRSGLPTLLAQQDRELNILALALANGTVTQATHDRRFDAIRANRTALLAALTKSVNAAQVTTRNLETAIKNGHDGLGWHAQAARKLEQDLVSTRQSITLF